MPDDKKIPHYPYPNLGNEEARARLNENIIKFLIEAFERFDLLQEARLLVEENTNIFREAKNLSGDDEFKVLKKLKVGLYPRNFSPIRTQIVAAAGIGKTTAVIDNLKILKGMVVWIMVPTLSLARELIKSIEKETIIKPFLFQGRNADTCVRYELARNLGNKGFDVQKTVCKNGDITCPHIDNCLYQEQMQNIKDRKENANLEDGPQVFVMTHGYLTANSPLPQPDIVIIDESHWQSFITITGEDNKNKQKNITVAEMLSFSDPSAEYEESYRNAVLSIEMASRNNPAAMPLSLKKDSRLNLQEAIAHMRLVIAKADRLNTTPQHHDAQIREEINKSSIPRMRLTLRLLECFQHEVKIGKFLSTSVNCDERGAFRIHALKTNMIPSEVPTLIIDASGSLLINQIIWGKSLKHFEIRTERNAKVIQVSDRTFSKQSLGIAYNDAWEAPDNAKILKNDLTNFIHDTAAETVGDVLVVGSKSVIEAIKPNLPKNVMTAHFGNLRGLNQYKHCIAAIIIGREQPSHLVIEQLTRGLKSFSSDTLLNSQDYGVQKRNVRMKDGFVKEAYLKEHIDSVAQAVLEQIREQEITQAIDRLRLINNGTLKVIYLLTSVPVDITVDQFLSWEEIVRKTKMDVAIQFAFKKGKAFSLADRDILAASPQGLWATPNAVGSYITRHGGINWVVSLIKYYIQNDPLSVMEYRHFGQRRWSKAIVSLNETDPKAALEKVIGKPITHFRLVGDSGIAPLKLNVAIPEC